MAAHVLRLRVDLAIGWWRGGVRRALRATLTLLVAALIVAGAWVGLHRLAGAPDDVVTVVTVIAGAAITLGFLLAPIADGRDDPLDPRRFAVFGRDPSTLAPALLAAGFVTLPVLAVAVLAAGFIVLWSREGVPLGVGVFAAVLGILTCVLAARIAFAVSGRVFRQRQGRELSALFLVAVLVLVVPIVVFVASLDWAGGADMPSPLVAAVDVLAHTPLAAAWAIPGAALAGNPTVPILIAVLTVLVLAGLWWLVVRWLLTSIDRPLGSRSPRSLGWFLVTPGTVSGAIAARSLIYWLRDPRYLVNVVIIPVAAVLVMVPLMVVGVPMSVAILLPAPIMALFFGWLPHNDLAYDSTALWMHVVSGVRGIADRWGRLAPVILIALPVLAVAIPVCIGIQGRWALLPAMAGVCASLLLCGFGLSSLSSVIAPYAVSRPGDSPFQQPQRTGGPLAQGMVFLGSVVLSVPALWSGLLTLNGDIDGAWRTLWIGLGVGAVVLAIGVTAGGWIFDRRSARLMEFAEST